jgi:integrase
MHWPASFDLRRTARYRRPRLRARGGHERVGLRAGQLVGPELTGTRRPPRSTLTHSCSMNGRAARANARELPLLPRPPPAARTRAQADPLAHPRRHGDPDRGADREGAGPKTVANALVPLGGILRFARRRGYILDDPLRRPEQAERPRPTPRAHRVLGQTEIAELLRACLPRYRPLPATALYTGMRLSELLALTWADIDFQARLVRVRAQLSRAHLGAPAPPGGAQDPSDPRRGAGGGREFGRRHG